MKKGTKVDKEVSLTYLSGLTGGKEYRKQLAEIKSNFINCYLCGGVNDLTLRRFVSLSEIVKKNNIELVSQAFNCVDIFDINNFYCLCDECSIMVYKETQYRIKNRLIEKHN